MSDLLLKSVNIFNSKFNLNILLFNCLFVEKKIINLNSLFGRFLKIYEENYQIYSESVKIYEIFQLQIKCLLTEIIVKVTCKLFVII